MKQTFRLLLALCAMTTAAHLARAYYDPLPGRFLSMDPIDDNKGSSPYTYCEGDPLNKIDPDGCTVEYANHEVFSPIPLYHSKLIIIPDNQAAYANDQRFQHIDSQGNHYATIGAGPVDGMLTSGVNRNKDIKLAPQNIQVLPLPSQYPNEDFAISKLFALNDAYNSHRERYTLLPSPWTAEYNSNSYISGLLGVAGYSWFGNTGADTPGWYPNWVPDTDFALPPARGSRGCGK